jgi:hypothetical protein
VAWCQGAPMPTPTAEPTAMVPIAHASEET